MESTPLLAQLVCKFVISLCDFKVSVFPSGKMGTPIHVFTIFSGFWEVQRMYKKHVGNAGPRAIYRFTDR